MSLFKTLAVLGLVGSTVAAPHRGNRPVVVVTDLDIETVTVYVTEAYGNAPKPTIVPEAPKPTVEASKPTVTIVSTPIYTPYPTPEPQPEPEPAPEPAPVTSQAPEPSPSSAPPSSNTGYMSVVDEWRNKLGLTPLERKAQLEGNCYKTASEGNGQMIHQLNPGSYGQVLAPGDMSEFEHVFVGGWLCERPDMPGMGNVCETQSKGWSYKDPKTGEHQTGHADILISSQYKSIGCDCAGGICCCDLGY